MKVSSNLQSCPICGQKLQRLQIGDKIKAPPGFFGLVFPHFVMTSFCYNPTKLDPLHYYGHHTDSLVPDFIGIQEFSIDLGHRNVLFGNDYVSGISIIKSSTTTKPLELSFLLVPDFPDLTVLRRRIKTSIVFA